MRMKGSPCMATESEQATVRFADAITRGDRDEALAVCHPEVELDSMLGITGRDYLGHAGILEYFDDVESAWEEWSVEVERTARGADGRIAIVMTMHARGKESGVTIAARTAHIWTLKDGKLLRNELYREPEQALRALGA